MHKIAGIIFALVTICACSAREKAVEHAEAACLASDVEGFVNAANNGTLGAYIDATDLTLLKCTLEALKTPAPVAVPVDAK